MCALRNSKKIADYHSLSSARSYNSPTGGGGGASSSSSSSSSGGGGGGGGRCAFTPPPFAPFAAVVVVFLKTRHPRHAASPPPPLLQTAPCASRACSPAPLAFPGLPRRPRSSAARSLAPRTVDGAHFRATSGREGGECK